MLKTYFAVTLQTSPGDRLSELCGSRLETCVLTGDTFPHPGAATLRNVGFHGQDNAISRRLAAFNHGLLYSHVSLREPNCVISAAHRGCGRRNIRTGWRESRWEPTTDYRLVALCLRACGAASAQRAFAPSEKFHRTRSPADPEVQIRIVAQSPRTC